MAVGRYYNTYMRVSYYTLAARITPGWTLAHANSLKVRDGKLQGGASGRPADVRHWPDPPHVALANLGFDRKSPKRGFASEAEIAAFTKTYGPLGTSDEAMAEPEEPFHITVESFRFHQRMLREAWEKRDPAPFTDPAGFGGPDWLPVDWKVERGRLEIRPANVYAYAGILLTRDLAERSAKVCGNPNCDSPYFVAKRRDAKYCSHPCAVAVNVRKFRQRERRKR
jgi:hypothetical protein